MVNNPRITYVLNYLNIKEESIPFIFLEYSKGLSNVKVSIFLDEIDIKKQTFKTKEQYVSLSKFCQLLSKLSGASIKIGSDKKSIYELDSHREILYTRLVLPEGLQQVEYEDETLNINLSEQISEFMRSLWQMD